MRPKNDLTKVIFDQSYNKGFNDGVQHGMNLARKRVALEFIKRLKELENTKGIGPKTWEKIMAALEIEGGKADEQR